MQTLWSRAAQAQSSCRCRFCLHSTNALALARRSTTAASRRRVTVADLFTACYTTILGTATLIDARRKNERRRELDDELDRARAALNQLAAGNPQSALDGGDGVLDGEASATSQPLPYVASRTANEPASPLLEELRSLCDAAYRPVPRPPWMRDLTDWARIDAAVAADEKDGDVVLCEPRSESQLAETTEAVLGLVGELLRRTQADPGSPSRDDVEIPDPSSEGILEEVEQFRRERIFPSYQLPGMDPAYSLRIRALLNESIRRIFGQPATLREVVGRICHNLLTVGVPPTVHTYNALIVGFHRIQRPDLAEAVVNSFLYQTVWPATETTVVCVVAHYCRPDGRQGLSDAVKRIWSARVDGRHLAPLETELYRVHVPHTIYPTPVYKRRYAVKKARRTSKVNGDDATFDHLIRGWLYHGDVTRACKSFVACLRYGSSIQIHTLQELFRGCLATADFANARKLLMGIIRNFENFRLCLSELIDHNAIATVRELLKSLYQVINICWLPFGELFGQTYQANASATASLKAMISLLDLQLEVKETAQLPTLLSVALSSSEPLLARLERALSILDTARSIRRTRPAFERHYIIIARVISFDRRYRDLEEKTQDIVAACNATIIGINTRYDIDARSLLLSDPARLKSQTSSKERLSLSRALSPLIIRDGPLTTEEVASQLLRRIPNERFVRHLEENDGWKRLSLRVLASFFRDNAFRRQVADPKKEAFEHPYHQQIHQQIREARDYIRALIFTHLSENAQRRVMSHYGFHGVPARSLVTKLKQELSNSLQMKRGYTSQPQSTVAYDTSEPLPKSRREEPILQSHSMPCKVHSSTRDMENNTISDWEKVHKGEEYENSSMFQEEDLPAAPG